MATPSVYSIIFHGDLAEGVDLPEVKQKASQLFKMNEQKIAHLFSGRSVTLKKGLELTAAKKYQKIIANTGMLVSIKENASINENSASSATGSAVVGASSVEHSSVQSMEWEISPVGEYLSVSSSEVTDNIEQIVPNFSLALPASDLLNEEEKKPRPDTLDLPSIESITISDVGVHLIEPHESRVINRVPEVDITHLSTQAAGVDLLNEKEKKATPISFPDTSSITLQ